MSDTRGANNEEYVGARTLEVGLCTDPVRAVYIATAGNLQVTMRSGNQVTWTALNAGQIYRMKVVSIDSLGTCTGLVLW